MLERALNVLETDGWEGILSENIVRAVTKLVIYIFLKA